MISVNCFVLECGVKKTRRVVGGVATEVATIWKCDSLVIFHEGEWISMDGTIAETVYIFFKLLLRRILDKQSVGDDSGTLLLPRPHYRYWLSGPVLAYMALCSLQRSWRWGWGSMTGSQRGRPPSPRPTGWWWWSSTLATMMGQVRMIWAWWSLPPLQTSLSTPQHVSQQQGVTSQARQLH